MMQSKRVNCAIYIVKFVNRQVRQSVWCGGSVIFFFSFY